MLNDALTAVVDSSTNIQNGTQDPIEEVLVANVYSAHGNRLVLTGRWDSPDFWLQQTLTAYREVMGEATQGAYESADALLRLSDLLLARAGLALDTDGAGTPAEGLKVHVSSRQGLEAITRAR